MKATARDFRPPLVVLRALGLGDLLTVVPALRALRRARADCRLVLACPSALHALVARADLADEAVDVRGIHKFATRLPAETAVNLHGRGPQSHRMLLALHPRQLVAFAHDAIPETHAMPEWRADEHEVDRWCRLLASVAIACDPEDLDLDAESFREDVPRLRPNTTLIHPGAAAPARRWPAPRFAAIARHELRCGRPVVLTGSAADRPRCLRVARLAGLPRHAVLAGRTNVTQLAAVVATSARVVVGDTGVAHLATALRRPSVVLFGPTPPSEWGPRLTRPSNRTLWTGHRGDPHGIAPDPGLLEIAVDDVVTELAALDATSG